MMASHAKAAPALAAPEVEPRNAAVFRPVVRS